MSPQTACPYVLAHLFFPVFRRYWRCVLCSHCGANRAREFLWTAWCHETGESWDWNLNLVCGYLGRAASIPVKSLKKGLWAEPRTWGQHALVEVMFCYSISHFKIQLTKMQKTIVKHILDCESDHKSYHLHVQGEPGPRVAVLAKGLTFFSMGSSPVRSWCKPGCSCHGCSWIIPHSVLNLLRKPIRGFPEHISSPAWRNRWIQLTIYYLPSQDNV